jgi:hypothetical protein
MCAYCVELHDVYVKRVCVFVRVCAVCVRARHISFGCVSAPPARVGAQQHARPAFETKYQATGLTAHTGVPIVCFIQVSAPVSSLALPRAQHSLLLLYGLDLVIEPPFRRVRGTAPARPARACRRSPPRHRKFFATCYVYRSSKVHCKAVP